MENGITQNMLSVIGVKKDTTWIEMSDICDGNIYISEFDLW